jgi:GrpB-like predicted nucleotidyltransferase (UPF0157 family)
VKRRPADEVVDFDPSWEAAFEQVRSYVWPAVEGLALAVEHVGSTAVKGLAAKPIIDVDVVVAKTHEVAMATLALAACGYDHEGDLGIPGREAYSGPGSLPAHHLYVVVDGAPPYLDHVDLRDYLRTHPEQALRYTREKRRLAHLLKTDREAYVNGKAWLVEELLACARGE